MHFIPGSVCLHADPRGSAVHPSPLRASVQYFFYRVTISTPGHLEWEFLSKRQSKLSWGDIRGARLAWQVLEGRVGTLYLRLWRSQFSPGKGLLIVRVANPRRSRHLCCSQEMYLKAAKISLFRRSNNNNNRKKIHKYSLPLGEKRHTSAAVWKFAPAAVFFYSDRSKTRR